MDSIIPPETVILSRSLQLKLEHTTPEEYHWSHHDLDAVQSLIDSMYNALQGSPVTLQYVAIVPHPGSSAPPLNLTILPASAATLPSTTTFSPLVAAESYDGKSE